MSEPDAPSTIFDALVRSADAGAPPLYFHDGEGVERIEPADLAERAVSFAGRLVARGVEPGDHVGLLGGNAAQWAMCAFAVWACGATLVPLPLRLRIRDAEAFREQLRSLIDAAGCRVVLAEPELLRHVPAEIAEPWDRAIEPSRERVEPADAADRPAVVQFTSGSTGSPKGAVLSHRAILASVESLRSGFGITQDDRYCGWLPLFHDNGIFGFVVRPIVQRCEGHVISTAAFARDPALWFRVMTERSATVTAGPSSGWAPALKAALRDPGGMDLGALELAIVSAEVIDAELVDRLETQGPSIGLRADSLTGAYGLAEATLGVTGAPGRRGIRIDTVDLDVLTANGRAEPAGSGARAKRIASCGRAHPGIELCIGEPGAPAPDRSVGEVLVRAPSLMDGYLVGAESPIERGWLHTGDLGYLAGGELYLTGRLKDVIVSVGRNYAPEDVEWAAARVDGVRPGRVVAFADPTGGEGALVVMLEVADGADAETVAAEVRRRVGDAVGLTPRRVVVAERGDIPKTTSGKLRRGAARDAYLRSAAAATP